MLFDVDYIVPNIKSPALFMDVQSLTIALKEKAQRLGFDLVGATPAVTPPEIRASRTMVGRRNGRRNAVFFRANRCLPRSGPDSARRKKHSHARRELSHCGTCRRRSWTGKNFALRLGNGLSRCNSPPAAGNWPIFIANLCRMLKCAAWSILPRFWNAVLPNVPD